MNQQYLIDTFGHIKHNKTQTLKDVMKIEYIVLTFIYLSIAVFGYLTFADRQDIK